MRRSLTILMLMLCTANLRAQDTVINPRVISQPHTIVLQNTDVYYSPVAPPASYDNRAYLCNLANYLTDSNGVFEASRQPGYRPITHGMRFMDWDTAVGWSTTWQRLFTARRRADHTPTDIIAGSNVTDSIAHGPVIVSKNEDVDFRASGRIWLKSGFHVMPGAFFHAYTEPKWGPAVLTDDFDSSAIDRTKWYVANGGNDNYGNDECLYDTNASIDTDYEAIDGHALDIRLTEATDSCSCFPLQVSHDADCSPPVKLGADSTFRRFASTVIRACPWPYVSRTGAPPVPITYPHAPYGKYEIREKIPHFLHHTNDWLYGPYEIDISEGYPDWTDQKAIHPGIHRNHFYGPFKGTFSTVHDTVFVSPAAQWSNTNLPITILVDGFAYDVNYLTPDSVVAGTIAAWPASLLARTDSITFYYSRSTDNKSDSTTWHVLPDVSGKRRIFEVAYRSRGTTHLFTRDTQPSVIALLIGHGPDTSHTFACAWDSSLNTPVNRGLLISSDTIGSSFLDSNTEAYTFTRDEGFDLYPEPPFLFDWKDSSGYRYHTYAVEITPSEIRYIYDSTVVLRLPDRLIPPTSQEYDLPSQLPRGAFNFYIGQLDLDNNWDHPDPMGTDSSRDSYGNYTSVTFAQRQDFESHAALSTWPGFWRHHGVMAAHDRIDYVRVWDLPANSQISDFPH